MSNSQIHMLNTCRDIQANTSTHLLTCQNHTLSWHSNDIQNTIQKFLFVSKIWFPLHVLHNQKTNGVLGNFLKILCYWKGIWNVKWMLYLMCYSIPGSYQKNLFNFGRYTSEKSFWGFYGDFHWFLGVLLEINRKWTQLQTFFLYDWNWFLHCFDQLQNHQNNVELSVPFNEKPKKIQSYISTSPFHINLKKSNLPTS